ncbi:hypothetical protein ACFXKD_00210 [Nocardiopsis aegyptia]|uniref:hypothetical protein n=1 Tax=Nocardiopsis aegyptia TaxID=220378 RepID=UPI00366E9440
MDRPDGQGTAQQNRPDGDSEEVVGGDAAPTDLVLHDSWGALFSQIFSTYARRLWSLLVVASLPAVPITLLGQALMVAPARDGVYLNGVLESAVDPLAPSFLVATGIIALLGLAVAPIVLGGSTLLGTAALLGRRISPRQAWQAALRRYFTTLTWILLLITLLAGSVSFLLWALSAGWQVALTAILVFGVLIPALTPLTVSLPLALVEGHGPFRALWEACRLARRRFGTHLLLVCLSLGVSVAARTGLEWALVRWTDLAEGNPVLAATTALAGLFAAPLSLLLACATVAYSGIVEPENPLVTPRPARYDEQGRLVPLPREEPQHAKRAVRNLDLVRAGQRLPEPASAADRSWALSGPRFVVVPALALAVFGPPLLGPGLLAANPFGLPEMASHPVVSIDEDELSVSMQPAARGALVGIAADTVGLEVCDPQCRIVRAGDRAWRGKDVLVTDGGALWTGWREYEHEDADEEERYDPHPDSGFYLFSCADITDCEAPDEQVQVRPYTGNYFDTASAITQLADGRLLVASYVRRGDQPEGATVEEDQGGPRLHLCADTACADPETVLLPPDLTVGGFLTDGEFLTLAASPEGGYAMAATDTARGSLSLVACAEPACTDPEVTEIHGEQFYFEHESRFRGRFGARVEFRSDGTPVLAYRAPQGGRARVVDCHDALCTEFTDTAVTGPGWARPVPGLAVDSQDRIHVLTPDFAQERLVLLSCRDRSCAQTSATPLEKLAGAEPAVTVLALDEGDRPHMLWGQGEPGTTFSGWAYFESAARYLRCAQPLCASRW